ncbi:hypothetical protein PIB30_003274 [Stylosanthes scabra]|uniref:Uncharacterized protein n=1 Tax=Stylosanthes scabra TaxID=79078 RepID=A0ABU6S3L7_9FABA|nr:hypothetical protein [Stylosanthes scabra]
MSSNQKFIQFFYREVLCSKKLHIIKEIFKLDYFAITSEDCILPNSQPLNGQQSAGSIFQCNFQTVGDGETIELRVGNTYSTSSRVYLSVEFARYLLPVGLGSYWTVIGPTHPINNRFKFKFVRNSSQANTYLFGGDGAISTKHTKQLRKSVSVKLDSFINTR